MKADTNISADARGLRVAIVTSAYHAEVTHAMERDAVAEFVRAGGEASHVMRIEAPGAFEVPLLVDAALARADVHAAVAIGCIVRGETTHDRHLGMAVTCELSRISVARGKPVGLAVLTVENMAQARARAGGEVGNKGTDAMRAALACVRRCEEIRR
jgi:6,7-dimethyl-8-ribityllumazine synthase